jgi:ATP-dependent exoDNAse (exonuclease V) beta subunit
MDEARNRERVRELTRLLYVTLTRPRHTLVIPWAEGFGGRQRESPSFAQLWEADPGALAEWDVSTEPVPAESRVIPVIAEPIVMKPERGAAPSLPLRILPHELASHLADSVRGARHESSLDQPVGARAEEAIDYGLWWHESVEFLPWAGEASAVDTHLAAALDRAQSLGLGVRGREELEALRQSAAWRILTQRRWTRQAELAVLAPLRTGGWVDGVVDLVLHDEAEREVGIIDWKTNRRRVGESPAQLLGRLAGEYAAQLRAYGECLQTVFPGRRVWLRLFASAAGDWIEIENRPGVGERI